MSVTFRLAPHSVSRAATTGVIEVYDGASLIATIYPGERAVRVISKHPMTTRDEEGRPQAVTIEIGRLQ